MASKKPPIALKPASEVPEVQAWEDVKAKLTAFKDANPQFFQYLESLIEEYNIKLQAAEKAVRDRHISCGEFELYQFTTRYDANALFQALGHEKFLQVGGKVETRTIYDVDKARVDASIASHTISPEIAEQIRTKSPNYHKPDPARIP